MSGEDDADYDPYVLRVRGLPWSATKEEIVKFFDGCVLKDGGNGIHLTMSREGRPSGEAYVEFETPEDATRGLDKDNQHLGSRYIEVFRSKANEMDWALKRCGMDSEDAFGEACVRLRGLPFGCSKEEIAQFFSGLQIVRNGITLATDYTGKPTGEAFVQFTDQEVAEKAMGKHKEKIGHRYIEIFKSSMQEVRSATGMGGPVRNMKMMSSNRMNPYERPGGFGRGGPRGRGRGMGGNFGDRDFSSDMASGIRDTGHNVHMRGLPFKAIEKDIFDFFHPLKPIAVRIKFESNGRSSGEADAMFSSHEEAVRALKKDKEKIQHRYIELFLQSEPDTFMSEGMGGGGGGGSFDNGGQGGYGRRPMDGGFGAGGSPGMGPPGRGRFGGGGGDRGFGGGSFGGPEGGRGFMGASREGSFGGGYGGLDKPYPPAQERSYGYGGASSAPVTDRNYGFGGGSPAGYNSPGQFGSSVGDRFGAGVERTADSYGGMSGGFRNGAGAGGAMGMRSEPVGYGNDRSSESDFYGSGKLFGASSYPAGGSQSANMMGPTSYPGY